MARTPSLFRRSAPVEGQHILGKLSKQITSLFGDTPQPQTDRRSDSEQKPEQSSGQRRRRSAGPRAGTIASHPSQPGSDERKANRSPGKRRGKRKRPMSEATGPQHAEDKPNSYGDRRSRRGGRPGNRRTSTAMVGENKRVVLADLESDWKPTGRFGDLKVSEPIERALVAMGYKAPSPIQCLVVPHLLDGRDLVGQAQTGTGKTSAFGIPIVERLKSSLAEPSRPLAIVLCPTRELAVQVTGELAKLSVHAGLSALAIYGGQAMNVQLEALNKGAHIVVATPGRLMDHMERRTIDLQQVKIVVLDEADQMLDIGFADDIERILRRTPKSRQTALFSATMPGPIKYLSRRYLRNPEWCRVGEESQTVDEVDQVYFEVAAEDRQSALKELLKDPGEVTQALIFRRTKIGVDKLVSFLHRHGYDAEAIHGDMTQAHRERVMGRFRDRKLRILTATNVAARGLDIPAVSHVVNYDMPDNLEEYVHRIGRTARMGREGTAYLFVSYLDDFDMLETIRNHVGEKHLSKRRLEFLYG